SVATFSSTSRVAPSSAPPPAAAVSHRPGDGPTADHTTDPSARPKAPASAGGSSTASSSWDRLVTDPSRAATTSLPGRAEVPSGPRPCPETNDPRHAYQDASNPTGSRNPRTWYRPRYIAAAADPTSAHAGAHRRRAVEGCDREGAPCSMGRPYDRTAARPGGRRVAPDQAAGGVIRVRTRPRASLTTSSYSGLCVATRRRTASAWPPSAARRS